jgi:hypothetical protein
MDYSHLEGRCMVTFVHFFIIFLSFSKNEEPSLGP